MSRVYSVHMSSMRICEVCVWSVASVDVKHLYHL